jgi:predicted nuclease with RNAse H fold
VGIDVAEARRGLDVVALDHERDVVASRGRLTVENAVSMTLKLRPLVVCIDSPSGWSTHGRSREAERQLARIGIQSYRTGPDPGPHPFYRWMRVGFTIFERLSARYPLYRGGAPAGTAAEVFPHATACLLTGVLRPSAVSKEEFRRGVLRDAGVPEHELETLDLVDAGLGALTGLIALDGSHSAVGDPNEGMILLPVGRVPPARLARGGRRSEGGSARGGPVRGGRRSEGGSARG